MDPWASGAREARIGARTAAVLVLSAAASLVAGEIAVGAAGSRAAAPVALVIAGGLVVLAVVLWAAHDRLPPAVLLGTALTMVLTVLATDLLTDDAGGGAQVAFLFPVVYAGAFLRPGAAWATAALAIACELYLTFSLLPAATAVTDASFVVVAITALTAVLVAAGRRQRDLVRELSRLVSVDSVTGLATRRVFDERAEQALEPVGPQQRRRSRPATAEATEGVGMLVVDVDRFKEFNDAHGHPRGDAALVHVASRLRAGVRSGDTVARLGGDEIAVLLPGVGAAEVEQRADALRRAIREAPLVWEGSEVHLSVSVGVAHGRVGEVDAARMYAAADAALYEAKRAGRDRTAVAPSV